MKVEPKYNKLSAIFPENRIYNVPKFQRAYSWQKANIEQFLSDIKYVINNLENDPSDHFMGGIVCVKVDNENRLDERSIFELVDGQQRLSTTVLLISRLINYLKALELNDNDSKIRDRRISKYRNKFMEVTIEEDDIEVSKPKINMSRRDYDYYKKLVYDDILNEPKLTSHKLLHSAALTIDKWLKKLLNELEHSEQLNVSDNLFKALSQAFNIIIIKMVDVSDAYKLFQVINDRGRSLTSGDLLRAGTLGMVDAQGASDKVITELENKWDQITSGGAKNTDDKLVAYYTSKTGKSCRKTDIFQKFNSNFFSGQNSVEDAIRNIAAALDNYEKLLKGGWPYDKSAYSPYQKNKLRNLTSNFKHTAVIPLLMAALKLREKKFYQLVFMLEKFFFLYRVSLNKRMTSVISVYREHIEKINKNSEAYQAVWMLKDLIKLIEKNVTSAEIDAYLDRLEYMVDGDNRSINYIFKSFEENSRWLESPERRYKYLYRHAFKGLDKTSHLFSIEHLYPKNAKENEAINELEDVKHKLGNLTLLYAQDNTEFSDDAFNSKKHEYENSRLNTTRPLAKLDDWNLDEYVRRDLELRKKFKKLFSFGVIIDNA